MVKSKGVTGGEPIDTIIYADPKKKDIAKTLTLLNEQRTKSNKQITS